MAAEKTPAHRVLVVTGLPFWLEHRGSSQRIGKMLDYLGTFCEVTVCFIGELEIRQWNQSRKQLGFELMGPGTPGMVASVIVHHVGPLIPRSQPKTMIQRERPGRLEDFQSEVVASYVQKAVAKRKPDVVILEYVTLAYLCDSIRQLVDPPLLVIDTHDLMHARRESLAKFGIENWLNVSAVEEIAALEKADVLLAIQEHEAGQFASLVNNHCRVCVAKHAVQFHSTFPGNQQSPDRSGKPLRIGFLGSAGKANRISLSDFIEKCWPDILSVAKDRVVLKIGGGISDDIRHLHSRELSQIEFMDQFENIADFYAGIDVAINPSLIPSGLKIKSLECLAYSVPLVTTSAGIAGLEGSVDQCSMVADDPNQFAQCVLRFVDDSELIRSFSNNCRVFIETEFTPESVYAELRNVIEHSRDT